MTDLKDIDQVTVLQSNLRATLGTDAGKEVIKFLEEIAGWYDFSDIDPNIILIKHGRRGLLATIKTLLEHTPQQIVAVAKQGE